MKDYEKRLEALEGKRDTEKGLECDRKYLDHALGDGPGLAPRELEQVSPLLRDLVPASDRQV